MNNYTLFSTSSTQNQSLKNITSSTALALGSNNYSSHMGSHHHLLLPTDDDDDPEQIARRQIEYIAYFQLVPVILLIGFINQVLNIATLSTLPLVGYMYLKASAVADLISIFCAIPFVLWHGNIHDQYSKLWMQYYAHVLFPSFNAFATASALCVVAMTIERYLSIHYPIAFHALSDSRSSRARVRYTIALIFIVSILIQIPSCWQRVVVLSLDANGRQFWHVERNATLNRTPSFHAYIIFKELIDRLIPIAIIVVLNLFMVRSLSLITARLSKRRASQTAEAKIRDSDRTRISVLLLITSCTFVVCTLPASLLSLFIDSAGDSYAMQIFRAFANLLEVSHIVFNFYLYILCSVEYRSACLTLFGCYARNRRSTTNDLINGGAGLRLCTGSNHTPRSSNTFFAKWRKRNGYEAPLLRPMGANKKEKPGIVILSCVEGLDQVPIERCNNLLLCKSESALVVPRQNGCKL